MDTSTWLTPTFITALATLIAAVTGLVVALKAHSTTSSTQAIVVSQQRAITETGARVEATQQQANGTLPAVITRLEALESVVLRLVTALTPTPPAGSAPKLAPPDTPPAGAATTARP